MICVSCDGEIRQSASDRVDMCRRCWRNLPRVIREAWERGDRAAVRLRAARRVTLALVIVCGWGLASHAAAQTRVIAPRVCRAAEVCVPPATAIFARSPTPFDAPVRFVADVKQQGETRWLWAKTVPSTCTTAQANDRNAYEFVCRAAIGASVFTTPRFSVAAPAAPAAALRVAAAASVDAPSPVRRVIALPRIVARQPRDACRNQPPVGSCAEEAFSMTRKYVPIYLSREAVGSEDVIIEVIRGGIVSRSFWSWMYATADGSVILPVGLTGPMESQRLSIIVHYRDLTTRTVAEDVKLVDLPTMCDPETMCGPPPPR